MTKEPFIAYSELTNEIYIVVGKEKYPVTEQAIKAVMATKALEQEPNKSEIPTGSTTKNDLGVDCISREQAIRELKESAEHHANDSREEALLHRDRDIIRALPPVTPIQSWISISEKLPEENGGYLVTVKRGYVTTALWVGIAENWKEVIAWMILPKPYEPRESEEV